MNAAEPLNTKEEARGERLWTEMRLIGALLIWNDPLAIRLAQGIIGPEHFSDSTMARMFYLISEGTKEGHTAFRLTHYVATQLREGETVLKEGGFTPSSLIAHCCANACTLISVEMHARTIRRTWLEDQMQEAVDGHDMPLVGKLAEEIGRFTGPPERDGVAIEGLGTITKRTIQDLSDAYQAGGADNDFAPCGLHDLAHAIGGWRRKRLYIIAGRPGMGKEQPIDTPILTPNGWGTIGSMEAGDYVIGRDGRPTRVLAIHPQGIKESYLVTFSDGAAVECGLDHLWTVYPESGRNRTKPVTKSTAALIKAGLTRDKGTNRIGAKWRIPVVAPVAFDSYDLFPIHPYVLGVLIGDGALSGRDLRFSNPDFDGDIRALVAFHLPSDVKMVENRSGACPYFSIRGPGAKAMRASIKEIGLNVLSGWKFIPKQYLFADQLDRLALLRGLMDTDGSSKNRHTTFYTTSPQLADDVGALVRSLGGIARISVYNRSHDDKSTEYVVRIRMAICPFLTERKASVWKPASLSRYITSIEPARMVEQVCITVAAKDGLYVTKDFIVTHNSTFALSSLLRTAQAGHGVMMFALEMGRQELSEMALCDLAYAAGERIEYRDISLSSVMKNGFAERFEAVMQVAPLLNSMPFYIGDRGGLTVGEVRSQAMMYAQRLQADGKRLEVICIDHLGLLKPTGNYRGNKVAETEEVSADLKVLAKEMDCAVIALCQLSRQVEQREDKRPNLSDLRWSGGIEQDADCVMFVYRAEYYLRKKEPDFEKEEKRQAKLAACEHMMEVLIEKQRGGPTAALEFFCNVGCAVVRDMVR